MELARNPKPTDRHLATGVHIASIFAPFLAPAVAWVLWSKNGFVVAHAKKALFEAIGLKIFLCVFGIVSISYSIWNLIQQSQNGFKDFSILPILLKFLAVWLFVTLLGIWNTVMSLRQAHRAYQGQLP